MDLTLLTCNYNTPQILHNLLRSVVLTSEILPKLVIMNTSPKDGDQLLIRDDIEYHNLRGSPHGEAVNVGLTKVSTRYVLLVDTDVIFLRDFKTAFEKFKESKTQLMGTVVGDVQNKSLYSRVCPWFCFIDNSFLNAHKIKFYDDYRSKKSKIENSRVYDMGSTMFEDIQLNNGLIADANMEGKYFKHYGGMSWRCQKYDPTKVDTDIDLGGTHPHIEYYNYGIAINKQYKNETLHLIDVNITGKFI